MSTCCFCGKMLDADNQHNPAPLADGTLDCCRECNSDFVIPLRRAVFNDEFKESALKVIAPQVVGLLKTAIRRQCVPPEQGISDISKYLQTFDTAILPYVKGYLCAQDKVFADKSVMVSQGYSSDTMLIQYYSHDNKAIMLLEASIADVQKARPCY